MYQISLFGLTV